MTERRKGNQSPTQGDSRVTVVLEMSSLCSTLKQELGCPWCDPRASQCPGRAEGHVSGALSL